MKKLPRPNYQPIEAFDSCIAEIRDDVEKTLYQSNRTKIVAANTLFDQETRSRTWCNLPRATHARPEQIIAGTLTKENLTSLYGTYLVKSKGDARRIYDKILVKANGKCPYCGGIGQAKTLDHYLPKARFPSYSVLPENLVPACRDCNTSMSSNFAEHARDQIIHPYLDDDYFFQDKWTSALVLREDPIVIDFGVSAPAHWSEDDKSRVAKHFIECKLKERYALQVGDELATLIPHRKNTLKNLNAVDFRAYLLEAANENSLPINGWKRTTYHALANTNWFYEADLNSPNAHMP